MKNKIKALIAVAMIAVATVVQAIDLAYPVYSTVTPGAWTSNRSAAIAYAQKNHMPLFAFCGTPTCDYCNKCKKNALNTSTFASWMSSKKIVLVYISKDISSSSDPDWSWVSQNQFGTFPACCVYWPKSNGTTVYKSFTGRSGKMTMANGKAASGANMAVQLVNAINSYITGWSPTPPTSQFSLSSTSVVIGEGDTKSLSVTRSGGTAALTVTLTIPSGSPITFSDGSLTNKLTWAANTTGAKSFAIKAPSDEDVTSNIVTKVTMSVPASTSATPTKNNTPTLTVTVSDEFVYDYSWLSNITDIFGDWDSTDANDLTVKSGDAAMDSLNLHVCKSGIIDVTMASNNTAKVTFGLGNKTYTVDNDYLDETIQISVANGDTLSVSSLSGICAIEEMDFLEFTAPTITKPANGAGIAKDSLKKNNTLANLAWTAVTGATKYIVKIGGKEFETTATTLNPVALGAVSTDGTTDTAYSWSVTAVRSAGEGIELGNDMSATASAKFTLTVQPTFNLNVTAATLVKKVSGTISVAASGAPGITYSASGLPAGMSINASTGIISGTPKKIGTYTITVTAKSSNGHSASKTIKVTVGKLPTSTLKGKFYGYAMGPNGAANAGYLVSINSSGKVTAKKITASGTAKVAASLQVSYASGAQKYVLTMDGKSWTYASNGFTSGLSVIRKQATNAALNSYSNLAVLGASNTVKGYLTVKVTGGRKAKVVGYIGGTKVGKSVNLAVSGSTGTGYFGVGGVYGTVRVVAGSGAAATTVVVNGSLATATGCKFASSMAASTMSGAKLTSGGSAATVTVSGDKMSIASPNKLSWKKAVGTFKGKFNGQSYNGAFVRINGVWRGYGVTTGGTPVVIAK